MSCDVVCVLHVTDLLFCSSCGFEGVDEVIGLLESLCPLALSLSQGPVMIPEPIR